jgi:hypothetical protein
MTVFPLDAGQLSHPNQNLSEYISLELKVFAFTSRLHKWRARIKARRGAGKAIIATARKFLGIIYLTLKNK